MRALGIQPLSTTSNALIGHHVDFTDVDLLAHSHMIKSFVYFTTVNAWRSTFFFNSIFKKNFFK